METDALYPSKHVEFYCINENGECANLPDGEAEILGHAYFHVNSGCDFVPFRPPNTAGLETMRHFGAAPSVRRRNFVLFLWNLNDSFECLLIATRLGISSSAYWLYEGPADQAGNTGKGKENSKK